MMMMIMMKDRKRSLMTPALEKNYWVFLKKLRDYSFAGVSQSAQPMGMQQSGK